MGPRGLLICAHGSTGIPKWVAIPHRRDPYDGSETSWDRIDWILCNPMEIPIPYGNLASKTSAATQERLGKRCASKNPPRQALMRYAGEHARIGALNLVLSQRPESANFAAESRSPVEWAHQVCRVTFPRKRQRRGKKALCNFLCPIGRAHHGFHLPG